MILQLAFILAAYVTQQCVPVAWLGISCPVPLKPIGPAICYTCTR